MHIENPRLRTNLQETIANLSVGTISAKNFLLFNLSLWHNALPQTISTQRTNRPNFTNGIIHNNRRHARLDKFFNIMNWKKNTHFLMNTIKCFTISTIFFPVQPGRSWSRKEKFISFFPSCALNFPSLHHHYYASNCVSGSTICGRVQGKICYLKAGCFLTSDCFHSFVNRRGRKQLSTKWKRISETLFFKKLKMKQS